VRAAPASTAGRPEKTDRAGTLRFRHLVKKAAECPDSLVLVVGLVASGWKADAGAPGVDIFF